MKTPLRAKCGPSGPSLRRRPATSMWRRTIRSSSSSCAVIPRLHRRPRSRSRCARSGAHSELIPLDEQDRSRWDRALITEGVSLVTQARARGSVGPYQLQAAIAAVHDQATRVEETDWPAILALYGQLEQISGNPMVSLNRAVAVAMVQGPSAALEFLKTLDEDPRIAGHYRLDAVRAHLYERAGERERALTHYRAAAERTASVPERDFLMMKAARLAAEPPRPKAREAPAS